MMENLAVWKLSRRSLEKLFQVSCFSWSSIDDLQTAAYKDQTLSEISLDLVRIF